jgi:flagellum-specific peptidoglycan hydrolase FlgJ
LYYAGLSEEQVYEKLQRQYATSKDYADKIKQIVGQLMDAEKYGDL